MKDYELLEKQASMMRMAEKYGVDWKKLVVFKEDEKWECTGGILSTSIKYKFALGVVEGRPVFEGDTLWNVPNGFSFVVSGIRENFLNEQDCFVGGALNERCGWVKDCSWNPPAPKTILVELLVEDAESVVLSAVSTRIAVACRKALEGLK